MPKGQAVSGKFNSWSDANEKRLLLLYGFKPGDWNFIAEKMGSTYSASACSQKYAKLKKAIEAEFGGSTGSSASTPNKRQRTATNGSAKKTKATTDQHNEANSDESSDEPCLKSPSKKAKKEKAEPVTVKADPSFFDDIGYDSFH